jgi:hypothetical protein
MSKTEADAARLLAAVPGWKDVTGSVEEMAAALADRLPEGGVIRGILLTVVGILTQLDETSALTGDVDADLARFDLFLLEALSMRKRIPVPPGKLTGLEISVGVPSVSEEEETARIADEAEKDAIRAKPYLDEMFDRFNPTEKH